MPEVYELPEGSLVRDAVMAAGGFSDKADRE
ncbi:MAG: SLBB domain-containing protein [Lachnospiraceae bacterium]|nr:SLBB domain-containing protein [Lachnospiraceae bacterium]